jgi:3-hydroxy-3-methylglutaryl CoA synthase/uncharacterized OB-fold protein
MRGIASAAGFVPHFRLDRAAIAAAMGSGGGKGSRAVATYDQDTTTLAVEAGRLALRSSGAAHADTAAAIDSLWFASSTPTYLEKTNATVVHAALRLDSAAAAFDFGGGVRSGIGALRAALEGTGTVLVATADIRTGLPTSADEAAGGDASAALLVSGDAEELSSSPSHGPDPGDVPTTDRARPSGPPVLAEYLGGASATHEFLDSWRAPGDLRTKHWEERFGETQYGPLVDQAWNAALKAAAVTPHDVSTVIVCGTHARAVRSAGRKLAAGAHTALADTLDAMVGNPGTAQAALLLANALEQAEPHQVIVLVSLADGVDALVFRTTPAIDTWRPARTVAGQITAGDATLPYTKFLSWRGVLPVEPPRRPEPARMSGSAAGRSFDWKYGFVGSRDRESGALHLPPARVSFAGGNVDDMEAAPMADATGTVVTFTIDRLAYSPSPPVVFAVVDFDGGGRLPMELTDVDATKVAIGDKVEMTFRRLNAADGIANYFWKARPVR